MWSSAPSGWWTLLRRRRGECLQPGRTPTILYNETIISFFDGCNSGQVEYSLAGQTLTLANMSVTELDCSSDALVQDASEHIQAIVSPGESTIALNGENILLERGTLGISGSPQMPD